MAPFEGSCENCGRFCTAQNASPFSCRFRAAPATPANGRRRNSTACHTQTKSQDTELQTIMTKFPCQIKVLRCFRNYGCARSLACTRLLIGTSSEYAEGDGSNEHALDTYYDAVLRHDGHVLSRVAVNLLPQGVHVAPVCCTVNQRLVQRLVRGQCLEYHPIRADKSNGPQARPVLRERELRWNRARVSTICLSYARSAAVLLRFIHR